MFLMRWPRKNPDHLSDEMALSLPSELGFDWPAESVRAIVAEQRVLTLPFCDFDGTKRLGQMVIHHAVVDAITDIFTTLFSVGFPIGNMVPIAAFGWDDMRSMAANNCVGFDFRQKTGRAGKIGPDDLSLHAYGRAIDVNPLLSPYIKDGLILPPGARFDPALWGTCHKDSYPVRLFKDRGAEWGGDWDSLKDYMHFEFPIPS